MKSTSFYALLFLFFVAVFPAPNQAFSLRWNKGNGAVIARDPQGNGDTLPVKTAPDGQVVPFRSGRRRRALHLGKDQLMKWQLFLLEASSC